MGLQRHEQNTAFAWRDATGPFRLVTEPQARQWNQDGAFLLEQVIPQATLDALIAAIGPLKTSDNILLVLTRLLLRYMW